MVLEKTKKESPKIGSPINYKVIVLIGGLTALLALGLTFFEDLPHIVDFTDFPYAVGTIACVITGLMIAKRYRGSEVFGKTYFALGLAFIMLFVGDSVWNYYTIILLEDPYPSIADVFYVLFYPFAIYHLIGNINYFREKIAPQNILLLIIVAVGITGWYTFSAFQDIEGEIEIEFLLGVLFVALSSTTLSLTILGLIVFHDSVLGIVWLLLASGMFILTFSDTWYYYAELTEGYTGNHPTNWLWGLSFMVITYALYKHKTII